MGLQQILTPLSKKVRRLVPRDSSNPNPRYQPQADVAEEIQKRMKSLLYQTKKNIMQSYPKYKAYFDWKAKAAPLATTDYCYIFNPKVDTQATNIPFENSDGVGHIK